MPKRSKKSIPRVPPQLHPPQAYLVNANNTVPLRHRHFFPSTEWVRSECASEWGECLRGARRWHHLRRDGGGAGHGRRTARGRGWDCVYGRRAHSVKRQGVCGELGEGVKVGLAGVALVGWSSNHGSIHRWFIDPRGYTGALVIHIVISLLMTWTELNTPIY